MSKIIEHIARENFRSSGYLSQPGRERRIPWTFTAPPRCPFHTTDAVRDVLQRRERASQRRVHRRPAFLEQFLHDFLHR